MLQVREGRTDQREQCLSAVPLLESLQETVVHRKCKTLTSPGCTFYYHVTPCKATHPVGSEPPPPSPAKRKTVSDCLVVICSRDIRGYSDAVIYRLMDILGSYKFILPHIRTAITKLNLLF